MPFSRSILVRTGFANPFQDLFKGKAKAQQHRKTEQYDPEQQPSHCFSSLLLEHGTIRSRQRARALLIAETTHRLDNGSLYWGSLAALASPLSVEVDYRHCRELTFSWTATRMPHGPRIALGCSSASIASCASLRRLTAFVRSSNHPSNRYRDRVWRNHALGERAARIKTSSAPPRAFSRERRFALFVNSQFAAHGGFDEKYRQERSLDPGARSIATG